MKITEVYNREGYVYILMDIGIPVILPEGWKIKIEQVAATEIAMAYGPKDQFMCLAVQQIKNSEGKGVAVPPVSSSK